MSFYARTKPANRRTSSRMAAAEGWSYCERR
jgi:hypothetical protein